MTDDAYSEDADRAELTPPCVAVIADLVASRQFTDPAERTDVQDMLRALVEKFNDEYSSALVSRFVITIGDELQGLLSSADIIPDFVWLLEEEFGATDVRFGFGNGVIHTRPRARAVGMDGPAFHAARHALAIAKTRSKLGGVFQGFGEMDPALNGLARLLRRVRDDWTDKQRDVVRRLRQGDEPAQIARTLKISPQAVSQRVRAAWWDAYHEAETGWRKSLSLFDTSKEWAAQGWTAQ